MSRNNRRPVIVGIFVLLAIVLFVTAVFTLGGQQSAFARTVRIYAVFDNVEGLKAGNNVWFSGVKIGVVKEVKFVEESKVLIAMNIEEDAQEYIRKDAKATLNSEGFIGNKLIEIVDGTTDYPSVEDGDYLEVKMTTGTTEIMKTLQDNNKNVLDITNNLKALTDDVVKGKGFVGALFSDTSKMTESVEATLDNLQQTSIAAQRAMNDLNRFTRKLNSQDGLVNDLLTDTVIYGKINTAVADLQRTAAEAARLTESLNRTSTQLNKTDNTAGMLLNDAELANEIRATINNLQKSTIELNKTLKALQGTFLLRKQVKKIEGGN